MPIRKIAVAEYDEYHYRDAQEGRDGVDREGEALGDEVADEEQHGAREHRRRHQDAVVGAGEEHAREVGHGQPDEADRTTEGGYGAGEQHGREEDEPTRTNDVETHRAGIVFAQKQQVEGFDRRDGERQTRSDDGRDERHLGGRYVSERTHGPDDERFERRLLAENVQDLDHRADARAEHHAEDQENHDVLDAAADGHDDEQHEGRTEPCGPCDAERLEQRVVRDTEQGAPKRKSATPSPAPELMPST